MSTSGKKHLVIVDGHHLLYRAYWAIPRTMKTSKGEQVNTAFGVASMLMMILKTEEPTHLLFCFDADEDTFRHKEYKEYKAGRAETPDDFYTQIPRTLSMIDSFGVKSVSGGGFEADDFACSYAKEAAKDGFRVTIVSGDRDLLQLVDDRVRVAIPHKGYQATEYLGPAEVKLKFGVTPEQIPSYKGLVGDSSDNLRGVKGIGPKAAAALLQHYPDIAALYEHLAEVKESWRTKLIADREQAFFCERMARLVCDIALPVALKDLEYTGIQAGPILDAFKSFEFSLVTRRFLSLLDTAYGRAHFVADSAHEAEEIFKSTSSSSRKTAAIAAALETADDSQLSLL
jgi:DNA polymerase I